MVYDWDGKEADCYRLYVEEKKSLDEVVEFWKDKGFVPSKRAFQTQFKRWEFPSKQNPAHKNPDLVARVKDLWEKNVRQKEMLEILNSEGFDLKERELMRVRAKNRWLLRVATGMKGPSEKEGESEKNGDGKRENSIMKQLEDAIMEEDAEADSSEEDVAGDAGNTTNIDPEVARRKQERLQRLQVESDERWRTRKRRRRTRGWAGLPADPAGPPRFPSETTIDESKAYLNLDNNQYRQVRERFQMICEEEKVYKKTIAGPDKWNEVKDRLIRENAHLHNVFFNDPSIQQHDGQSAKQNQKSLSLDVICTDVTKRMRTLERRMTIADAKNGLGLNPEESRLVRQAFYAKLRGAHISSKLEVGDDQWKDLKAEWIAESDLLQRALVLGEQDPQHEFKIRATETLARDVMKRLRDDMNKIDPSRKRQHNTGPGPGPAKPSMTAHTIAQTYAATGTRPNLLGDRPGKPTRNQTQSSRTYATRGAHAGRSQRLDIDQAIASPPDSEFQIDPSLLLAANDQSAMQNHHHDNNINPYGGSSFADASYSQHSSFASPIPVYFRLHQHSTTPLPNKTLWLSVLQLGTVDEIKMLATREHPGTSVLRIEGLVSHRTPGSMAGNHEREIFYAIDDEAELGGYLAHVAGGKVTFVVQLAADGGNGFDRM
ncbi:hypothetical protein BU16DRAFT_573344 [Lophium mytilinum]|uniref:Uncharacterized protein n=1 Tax=Lophium mytilinum TaxID=390894 RepID=A0A6A6QNJ5_9PEZI|nr:hypothetical protein BU16DRAFT_573344 [Lophium mytilinum]